MIYEVAAAVEHIVSLIQHVERRQPIAPESLAAFASTLKDALEQRCQACWKPSEPEFGSARRSIAWQLHAAGEGADADILRAVASVVQAQAEEGEIVVPHQPSVVALALQWIPIAFTLWIDPGCVAVRVGSGPGASRSFQDFDLAKSGSASSAVQIVWGQMVAESTQPNVPQLTVTSVHRPIPIIKPAAAAHARYPVQAMTNRMPALNARHQRAHSASSSVSSDYDGLVRSASMSSTNTVSTHATSVPSDVDAESEACPSLASASPTSSLVSSQCTPQTDNDRESVHDTTIGDTTERFAGVRLFDEDDDDQDAGDATLDAGSMLGLGVSKLSKPAPSSTSVKCNYTTHDNGNVGVLGGGVKLGGASASTKTTQPPRYRQHSNSKSVSHLQGFQNQLLPPYMPHNSQLAHQMPRQLRHMSNANYSAPMRTVPLPAAPMAPQHFHPHQPVYQQYHAAQPQRAAVPPMSSFAHPSGLPTPYAFRNGQAGQQHYVAQPKPHMLGLALADGVGGDEQDGEHATTGRRRLRSRGRRSRGRGAGRAARRQAAALRALELGSTEELGEFDDDDEDDEGGGGLISRCSTPATGSEYTCSEASSSCVSSTTSLPAKPTTLSKRGSRANMKPQPMPIAASFGLELHSGLARLQTQAF